MIHLIFVISQLIQIFSPEVEVHAVDPCLIFGSVYVTDEPHQADIWVYEESTEAFADLMVYVEENNLMADREGTWFFEENKGFARFRIYFVDDRNKSHFSVYFTDVASFAGCK